MKPVPVPVPLASTARAGSPQCGPSPQRLDEVIAARTAHDKQPSSEGLNFLRVRIQTSARIPVTVAIRGGRGYLLETKLKVPMLFALAVILLILAVAGGIAVHPLLFLLAIVAVLVLVSGRRGTVR
jgi:hypothetical protein